MRSAGDSRAQARPLQDVPSITIRASLRLRPATIHERWTRDAVGLCIRGAMRRSRCLVLASFERSKLRLDWLSWGCCSPGSGVMVERVRLSVGH